MDKNMKNLNNIKAKGPSLMFFALFILLMATLWSFSVTATEIEGPRLLESHGSKDVAYLVKDINALERPNNYVIGQTKFAVIEILGILAALGAIGFALLHGFGRYLAGKKIPVLLEEVGREHIYNLIVRSGHWLNAITIVGLLISGFIMHYTGPDHLSGYIHNWLGYALVLQYALFLFYEIASGDIKQYIPQLWELKEGILKQALFYAVGIFKREEHPYHMKKEKRLNPLQKPAYFGIMFGLMPVVVLSGFILLRPDIMGFFIIWIGGLENMKFIFIIHLVSAFGMLAFLLGHLYLATTGDKVKQHFEVMITGSHRIYKVRLKD
jgi:thiosulfate reductase cytochrome b subunit